MKEILIDKKEIRNLSPIFKGRFGNILLKVLFKLSGMNKVNAIYDASKQYEGIEFVNDMIKKLDIKLNIENIEVLDRFKDQAFITVSNHPYGHIDGILAIHIIGNVRPDYKVMVNWLLMKIDTMGSFFIGVNPYSKDSKLATMSSSIAGFKQCLQHVKDGHPLGFFPAGGVSTPHLNKTEDREWQEPVLRLIKKSKVPVIPMFFAGNNSWFYRFLGFIDWRIRTARLLHEVTNKSGKTLTVRLGEPIYVEEQAKISDIKAYGEFLKQQTYALKKHPNK